MTLHPNLQQPYKYKNLCICRLISPSRVYLMITLLLCTQFRTIAKSKLLQSLWCPNIQKFLVATIKWPWSTGFLDWSQLKKSWWIGPSKPFLCQASQRGQIHFEVTFKSTSGIITVKSRTGTSMSCLVRNSTVSRNNLVTSLMFWPYCELVWRPQMPDAKNYPVFMLRHESLFGLWLACCGELTFFSKCEVVRCLGDLNIFVAITSYKYIIGKCYIVTLRFSSLLL